MPHPSGIPLTAPQHELLRACTAASVRAAASDGRRSPGGRSGWSAIWQGVRRKLTQAQRETLREYRLKARTDVVALGYLNLISEESYKAYVANLPDDPRGVLF